MYELNLSPGFRAEESRYADFTEMAEALPAPRETIGLQVQAIAAHDTSARLPDLSTPTLVIHGTVDRVLGYPNGPLIASLIPGARLETYEDVGHMFWWEQPERTRRAGPRARPRARPEPLRLELLADVGAAGGVELAVDLEDVVGLGNDVRLFDHQLQRRVVFHPGVDRVPVFGRAESPAWTSLMIR